MSDADTFHNLKQRVRELEAENAELQRANDALVEDNGRMKRIVKDHQAMKDALRQSGDAAQKLADDLKIKREIHTGETESDRWNAYAKGKMRENGLGAKKESPAVDSDGQNVNKAKDENP